MDATDWDQRYAKAELEWGSPPNRFLVQEITDLETGSALDLAAGEGRNAVWLAEQGWTVTAVDFSQVAIDKARKVAAERGAEVRWIVADVVAYAPDVERYDLVIIFYLHIPASEMERVLAHATRALKPGGTILIVGHDRTNIADGVGGPQDPAILYDSEELVSQLDGLIVEKAARVTRPVEDAERDAIDTLVRARRP